jgi:hypothetical protein
MTNDELARTQFFLAHFPHRYIPWWSIPLVASVVFVSACAVVILDKLRPNPKLHSSQLKSRAFGGIEWAAVAGTDQPVSRRVREEHMVCAGPDFDAVVIGAGFSGMYMLKALRDRLGLKVRVYEAGETVGGTWYWNRYPGARCDSEAYVYCFTWDKELLREWEWSERYPEQPEILRYLEHVAARHDLKRDICFDTRVTGAQFDEASGGWNVRTMPAMR